MISFAHVHCEEPGCYRKVAEHVAEWSKKKYGKVYCFQHCPRTVQEVTKPYQTK